MPTFASPGFLALFASVSVTQAIVQNKENLSLAEVYQAKSEQHGQVELKHLADAKHGGLVLQVTYKPPGGTAASLHAVKIIFKELDSRKNIAFNSLVDKETGCWCIYDTAGAQFIYMALPPTRGSPVANSLPNFWHPGVHIGWLRGFWADLYKSVQKSHSALSYANLVGERPRVREWVQHGSETREGICQPIACTRCSRQGWLLRRARYWGRSVRELNRFK